MMTCFTDSTHLLHILSPGLMYNIATSKPKYPVRDCIAIRQHKIPPSAVLTDLYSACCMYLDGTTASDMSYVRS